MTINRLNQGVTNQVLVKAVSGQTTNLLELQDSTGAVVSSIGPTGALGGTIGNSGLVHIKSRTVTASTSEIFNDIFSAAFDHYKIIISGVNSASGQIHCRLRVGGVDNSTASSYVTQRGTASGANANADRHTNNFFFLGSLHSSLKSAVTIDIFEPFIATQTVFLSEVLYAVDGARRSYQGGSHNQTVSFDGLNFLASSGNFTFTISIYGYRK